MTHKKQPASVPGANKKAKDDLTARKMKGLAIRTKAAFVPLLKKKK